MPRVVLRLLFLKKKKSLLFYVEQQSSRGFIYRVSSGSIETMWVSPHVSQLDFVEALPRGPIMGAAE